LARDRMGIKPLFYYHDEDKFIFASEMKSLIVYGIKKDLDWQSVFHYFQLNYIPAPYSIFKDVKKVLPGCSIIVKGGRVQQHRYYKVPIPSSSTYTILNYQQQQSRL